MPVISIHQAAILSAECSHVRRLDERTKSSGLRPPVFTHPRYNCNTMIHALSDEMATDPNARKDYTQSLVSNRPQPASWHVTCHRQIQSLRAIPIIHSWGTAHET